MTGGPGYSTTAGIDSIGYDSGLLKYGGFIAFDQRGTRRAIPNLEADEVFEAIKQSYREQKNRDSLVLLAVKTARGRLRQEGIDLSAYNTAESTEDINDLRMALGLDSLNLVGISYSGGLMLAMAQRHPEGVRSLVLNSPLPNFVSYEETALQNINEALDQVFVNCAADSAGKPAYRELQSRFQTFFSAIGDQRFTMSYTEKGSPKPIPVRYGKQELLDAIIDRLNTAQVATVPWVISEILSGRGEGYVKEVLDGYFAGNPAMSLAMRYSVYCSGQLAFADARVEKQQAARFPWLAGYRFNNVDHVVCDCWQVRPVAKATRLAFRSNIPALITAGDIDPWCRPDYNRQIKKSLPNAQLLIQHRKGHAPGFVAAGVNYLDEFMRSPLKLLKSSSATFTIE